MLYCSRRKKMEHNCPQGESNWCTTVLRRRKQVLHCFKDKGTGALLLSEGNWCSTVFRRNNLVLYCSQEKETVALLPMFSGEGDCNWCFTVLRRRAIWLYCTLKNKSGAVPSLLVNSDESRQLVLVKFGKHFGFFFQQKIIGFIGFI